jgi:NadR type nicotinamide-nucleotide adenylyltransferase
MLIKHAREHCDELIVLVGGSITESIPLEERAKWVKMLFPDVKVVSVWDEIPDDFHDDDIWNKHIELFKGAVGAVDVIFSSEAYGEELAHRWGARHALYDESRRGSPISASMIREDTSRYWNYLSRPAATYLTKRIVIVGAESTGTSTLAMDLLPHLDAQWVPEYGRRYVEEERNEIPWEDDDFLRIAVRQQRLEDESAQVGSRYTICDTNAFATKIWQERYMGHASEDVQWIARSCKADLYILTDERGVPFDQDGTRDGGKTIRRWMNREFREQLEHYGLPWVEVSGSPEMRVIQALVHIKEEQWRFAPPLTREGSWRPLSQNV